MKIKEQGFDSNRYKVILRTLIFIFFEDQILLLKGAPDKKIWANKFNGIGGHVEPGEDILTSAQRELFEETGITCDSLDQKGSIIIDIGAHEGILIFIFAGKVNTTNVIQGNEGNLHWVPISEIQNYPLVEDLKSLIPMILDKKTKYISGYYRYVNDELIMNFNNIC